MELKLTTATGRSSKTAIQVDDAVFAREFNEPLVHQVVVAYLAGGRSGTKAQKSRRAVSGGGTKPWRQKGTGRARAGSIRSPLWRGGGTTFAASPRDHSQKVNRKMYRGAVRAILSERVRQGTLVVMESFALESLKTKDLAAKLKSLEMNDVLILVEDVSEQLRLAARNLANVEVRAVSAVDPVSLVGYEKILATKGAVERLGELFG